ncbi:MAG: hypothetical protein K6G58_04330 [Lachnospiraceae bacterium]|nr:hypothetical protein [Lachnospiraceae bacterium]
MDGFRERLSARYDRSGMRGNGYDRTGEDRYDVERERYERSPRRGNGDGVSSEAVSEAVVKANREQLEVIADYFDEAKADRMESERAIIDAINHGLADAKSAVRTAPAEPVQPLPVVDEQTTETLARIERIAGQNAETINESNEMLERNVDSLRSNSEILNEIRGSIGSLLSSSEEAKAGSAELYERIDRSLQELSARSAAPQPMQDLTVDFTSEKDEIIGAVGDNRAILNMIRQDVLNGFAKSQEVQEEPEDKPVPLTAEDADRYYKELEDHVHKECVKCYRNVQSALTEQNTEANTGVAKSVSGMRIMVLLSMIFSILGFVGAVLNLLYNLGIIMF